MSYWNVQDLFARPQKYLLNIIGGIAISTSNRMVLSAINDEFDEW